MLSMRCCYLMLPMHAMHATVTHRNEFRISMYFSCRRLLKHDGSLPSPGNVMVGFYMVLWGYFGMHCGSTFGIRGERWKLTARHVQRKPMCVGFPSHANAYMVYFEKMPR